MQSTQKSFQAEYEAFRSGAALFDFSSAGKLQLSGKNAVQFLNGLVSNDVKALEPGSGVLAAFPTLQGKLLALCRIYNTGQELLLELDAINREKIFKNLSRFVPAGEFFVTDLSDQLALLSLQGPKSIEIVEALIQRPVDHSRSRRIFQESIGAIDVKIASHHRCGTAGFDFFVPAERASELSSRILAAGENFGTRAATDDVFEIVRIEAGVPREGVDAGENYIVLESELEEAVSYTKGCYLGQEIIARIHWRGQPAKRLRGLLIEAEETPHPGDEIWGTDDKKVGEITSSVRSPALNRVIALGYIHRRYLDEGTKFTLKRNENAFGRAELAKLPFVAPTA
jgi:folate-binding protein YgfZ